MSDIPSSFEELFRQAYPDVQTLTPQEIEQLVSGTYVAPTPPVDDPYYNKNRYYSYTETIERNGRRIEVLKDGNGTVISETDIGPVETTTTDTTTTTTASTGFQPQKDARNTIKAVLATYGLGELSDYLYSIYAKGEVDVSNSQALIFALREQPAYQKRFAANAARAKKGLAELDPSSYIDLENSYRQLLQSNGLPTGFYDQTEDFVALLEGDVSPQELQDRVRNGFRAVQDADPEVKRQMQELYGVGDSGLAAYFLDPTKAAPLLTRQAEAAKVAARAKEQGGIQLGAATAEEIVARGITAAEAEAGFKTLGLQEGLYTEMMGEQALTEQQKVGAAFGYDVESQKRLAERRGLRKSPFQGGGSFAKTTGKTSGPTQTGLGVAE